MNPDNNALERTWFIGGAPRIGKTILSITLAKKIRGHYVSTDSIRNAAKKACTDEKSDLFILNTTEHIPEEEWLKNHNELPEKVIEYQNRESTALWPSIVSFCNSFCEDNAVHIVEGVALLPSLVAQMKDKPKHIFYVGNTSERHVQSMLDFAKKFPQWDWMGGSGYSDEKIRSMANFVREMSVYFKTEAEQYGFPYYEIADDDFDGSLAKIIDTMTVM
jgi:2-phosphoglycerate kinase